MTIGIWQIVLVLGLALLFLGPKRLPSFGKSMGEAIRGFKKGLTEDDSIDVTDSEPKASLSGNQNETEKTSSTAKEKSEA